jgi:hypothetical protein
MLDTGKLVRNKYDTVVIKIKQGLVYRGNRVKVGI